LFVSFVYVKTALEDAKLPLKYWKRSRISAM